MPLPVPPAHVVSVHIVHYPDAVLTRVALSPAQLERLATVRVTVRDRRAVDAIVHALDRMGPSRGHELPDSRWGVTLAGPHGATLARVYLDRFGARALIDNRPARVDAAPVVRLLSAYVPRA